MNKYTYIVSQNLAYNWKTEYDVILYIITYGYFRLPAESSSLVINEILGDMRWTKQMDIKYRLNTQSKQ